MERRPPPKGSALRPATGGRLLGALTGTLLLLPAALGAGVLAAPGAAAAPGTGAGAHGPDGTRATGGPAPGTRATGGPAPGTRATGGPAPGKAAPIGPGEYMDTVGPGETRWYAAALDAVSTADLSVTAVPKPGVAVDYGDGLELKLVTTGDYGYTCDDQSVRFGQDEGAMNLTGAVSRVPSHDRTDTCDKAGRYLLSVHRTSAAASDRARWPIELTYVPEAPLPAGTVPAAAQTDYGPAPAPATGTPRDITGGTGFQDAPAVATGVWRDRLLPAQTRYYKVRVGWGQQLTYAAEFANTPVRDDAASTSTTFVTTSVYAPNRLPVGDASDARGNCSYDGTPVSVGLGTVPVAWTNRWVSGDPARDVHTPGAYWIAVGLGPNAARLTKGAGVRFVLRVEVTGDELVGPQYQAPSVNAGAARTGRTGRADGTARKGGTVRKGAESTGPAARVQTAGGGSSPGAGHDGAIGGITGTDLIAAGTGGAVAFTGVVLTALVHRTRNRTTRGGA